MNNIAWDGYAGELPEPELQYTLKELQDEQGRCDSISRMALVRDLISEGRYGPDCDTDDSNDTWCQRGQHVILDRDGGVWEWRGNNWRHILGTPLSQGIRIPIPMAGKCLASGEDLGGDIWRDKLRQAGILDG